MQPSFSDNYILPDWPDENVPANVKALVTTRFGGVSHSPYTSFNLALHVGDAVDRVLQNRKMLAELIGDKSSICWLDQQHGTSVFVAKAAQLDAGVSPPIADAVITSEQDLACAVMTADCLPVIFCAQDGSQVAVAHAGWRGLCAGVLEQTIKQFNCPAQELIAWLGPAIGPKHFEVGPEVREAFLTVSSDHAGAFEPGNNGSQRWMANLYMLAQQRLKMQGVERVSGGNFCTYKQQDLFYSYRRDGATGRMATLIWIESD